MILCDDNGQQMNKRPEFGDDLKVLTTDVETNVAGMLQLLNNGQRDSTQSTKPQGATKLVNEAQLLANEVSNDAGPKQRSNAKRRLASHARQALKAPEEAPIPLVNVTTRLTHAVNQLLTEASLRQRLKRTQPASRQDIIEEAIRVWLIDQGYLTSD